MTNWARIIAKGWPGARFTAHEFIDLAALANALGEEAAQAVFDAACEAAGQVKLPEGRMVVGNAAVEWRDESVPMPARDDVVSRRGELQAEMDALAAARLKAKAFADAYPPEKIIEYLSDDAKKAEVISAALAAKAAG